MGTCRDWANKSNSIKMTADQKTIAADFLDSAESFLSKGYKTHIKYTFEDTLYQDDTLQVQSLNVQFGNQSKSESRFGNFFAQSLPQESVKQNIPLDREKTNSQTLKEIADCIAACTNCDLAATRTLSVAGEGVPHPLVLIIGEGPGNEEDQSGKPFVGKAGQLLDKMLESIGLSRKTNCFITNIVKCRPPGNRDPLPQESAACASFLQKQIDLLKPLIILALGNFPAKTLLDTATGITKLRGNWKQYNYIPFLPTFHPSYLLRDATQKAAVWEDLKMLCRRLVELDSVYAAATEVLRRERKI